MDLSAGQIARDVLGQALPKDQPLWDPCPTLAWGLWSSGGGRGCTDERPKHTAKPGVSAPPALSLLPCCPPLIKGISAREGGGEGTGILEHHTHRAHSAHRHSTKATPRHRCLPQETQRGLLSACGHTAHQRHRQGLALRRPGSNVPTPPPALRGSTVPPVCPHQSEGRTNSVQNNRDPDKWPEGKLNSPWGGLSP